MKHIILGLIIAIISFLLLKYNEWLIRQTGTWYWAERHFGSEGGTRLFLKLISIFALVAGLMTIAGLHERFVRWIFAPLFKIPLSP